MIFRRRRKRIAAEEFPQKERITMTRTSNTIDAYLEIGSQRVFAGALDWPGGTGAQ
jgi:hypothetical protein